MGDRCQARLLGQRLEILETWSALQKVIRSHVGGRTSALVTLAAAMELGSSRCALAHGDIVCDKYVSRWELKNMGADNAESPPARGDEQAIQ